MTQQPDGGSWQPAPHGQSWIPAASTYPVGPSTGEPVPGAPGNASDHVARLGYPSQDGYPNQVGYPNQFGGPHADVPPPTGGFAGGPPPTSGHPWLPTLPLFKPSALPDEPRQYHEFLRAPAMAWWRPIAALAMGAVLWFVSTLVITGVAMAYDLSVGNTTLDNYTSMAAFKATPAFFLANNLALASSIPIAALTQWACFGQRPRWMSSVVGGFRWSWFGECLVWVLPPFVLSAVIDVVLNGPPPIQITASTGFMIAAILLTTPLQAAGEEYLLRGLGQRAIAAWLPRTVGLVVSTAITALIFMLLHGAGDPWLNAFYLIFAVTASVLAWRTGGLEAAIAMHVVNNLVSMTFLPFTDISQMFNREDGSGSPWLLAQMAIMLGAAALVLWRAKLRNVVTMAAPAAALVPASGQPQESAGITHAAVPEARRW